MLTVVYRSMPRWCSRCYFIGHWFGKCSQIQPEIISQALYLRRVIYDHNPTEEVGNFTVKQEERTWLNFQLFLDTDYCWISLTRSYKSATKEVGIIRATCYFLDHHVDFHVLLVFTLICHSLANFQHFFW